MKINKITQAIFATCAFIINPLSKADEKASLAVESRNPRTNLFILEEPIKFTFRAQKQPSEPEEKLIIRTENEKNELIEQIEIPPTTIDKIEVEYSYNAPSNKLGFYRIYARTSSGTTTPSRGSIRAGQLTYGVTIDPKERRPLQQQERMFGMQGGFSNVQDTAPFLGFNWINGPGAWAGNEPDHPGQYQEKIKSSSLPPPQGTKTWPIYPIFSVHNPPDWAIIPGSRVHQTAPLKAEALPFWESYLRNFSARMSIQHKNDSIRIYQITWEPNWFQGTPKQFIDIYRTAYRAIHETDKLAYIIGPTKSTLPQFNKQEEQWFEHGLGNYIDGYSIHPYTKMPLRDEEYINLIRDGISKPRKAAGRSLSLFSTEQGDSTRGSDDADLTQARNLIRASIITLGEGAKIYIGFYIHDLPDGKFGYFYYSKNPFKYGADALEPKPVALAFSTETRFLDGFTSSGQILDLQPLHITGYSFQRGNEQTAVLWTHTTPINLIVPDELRDLKVFDWMGNEIQKNMEQDTISVKNEPIYITGKRKINWQKAITQ